MPLDPIFDRLTRILTADFGKDGNALTPTSTLRGTLMMDSLDLVDLVFFIEREFGMEARVDEVREIRSLASLVEFIRPRARRTA